MSYAEQSPWMRCTVADMLCSSPLWQGTTFCLYMRQTIQLPGNPPGLPTSPASAACAAAMRMLCLAAHKTRQLPGPIEVSIGGTQ